MARDNVIAEALRPFERPDLPDGTVKEPPPERFQRRGRSTAPAAPRVVPQTTVEDIYAEMSTAVTTFLDDPDPGIILLLAAPPGGGKTRLMVRTAEHVASDGHHHALYAGPNHEFFRDVLGEAAQPAWWYEWKPRRMDTEVGLNSTCRYAPQMQAWLRRGYRAEEFCRNPRICGWDYVNNQCPYHAQKRRNDPIIFAQHAHVALTHPLMERMSLVIGDESPLSAFLYETQGKPGWVIPIRDMVPPDMETGPIETLLRNLRMLAQYPPDDATHWQGAELYRQLPGGPEAVIEMCEAATIPLTALAYGVELRSAEGADEAPYFHLPELVRLLKREARRVADGQDVIPRVRLGLDGLTLLLRRSPTTLPPHVIWCDATANERIYRALFQGRPVRIIQPEAALKGRIFQVYDSLNNKASLVTYGAQSDLRDETAGTMQLGPKVEKLRAQIARIVQTHGYTRPARISYKTIVDHLGGSDADSIGHFGAARGTNRMQDCDALFVVGAPQPPLAALLDTAAMIFFERDDPFDTTWSVRDIPFAGQSWAYSVGGFWNDADLQALLYQVREAELLQAIHRARPLRRDVDIWLLTNVVIPDLPVELVSVAEVFDTIGPDGKALPVDPYRWPEVQSLADAAYANGGITAAMIAHQFHVPSKTSLHWLHCWAARRGVAVRTIQSKGRGRPSQGCVKDK